MLSATRPRTSTDGVFVQLTAQNLESRLSGRSTDWLPSFSAIVSRDKWGLSEVRSSTDMASAPQNLGPDPVQDGYVGSKERQQLGSVWGLDPVAFQVDPSPQLIARGPSQTHREKSA